MAELARWWIVALLGAWLPAALAQGDVARAAALLQQGNAREAYELLAPHEPERAGEVEFDYLLGGAALDAGFPDRATLVLERVLLVRPNHVAARLDLARAYYALGDFSRAQVEFRAVLTQDPPPQTRASVEAYLAAIEQRPAPGMARAAGYAEATFGYDTNVNYATRQAEVFAPVFGVSLQLDPASRSLRAGFAALGGGGEIQRAITGNVALFAGADARVRANSGAGDAFDTRQLDLRAGVQGSSGASFARALLSWQRLDLDGAHYRDVLGAGGEWRAPLGARSTIGLFASWSQVRHAQELQEANDVDQALLGAALAWALGSDARTTMLASLHGGRERAVRGRLDGDRALYGMRLGAQRALRADLEGFAALSYQHSDYRTQNLIFGETRRDRQLDLVLGLAWRFERQWLLRPQIAYTHNASNLSLNAFSRYEASLTLRREFR